MGFFGKIILAWLLILWKSPFTEETAKYIFHVYPVNSYIPVIYALL